MNFQDLTLDHDWSDAVRIRNLYNWTNPVLPSDERNSFAMSRKQRNDARFVGVVDGAAVSYSPVTETTNSPNGDYWFAAFVDPNDPHRESYLAKAVEESMRRIAAFGGKRGMVESRGEYEWEAPVLLELGFEKTMTLPFSCLEVAEHDYSYHPQVVTFSKFLELHPEDGVHQIWRCEMECAADLPLPFPFVETPYEVFRERILEDPNVDLTCKFLFWEDGVLRGLTTLWPSKVNPKLAATGITGTRPQYRRQGVARRMKEHVIAWSKERGIEKIFTDNEENNPMFQLNLQLGFRKLFDYEVYSKSC